MTFSFPFSLILIPYGLIVLFFVILALVNIFHLVAYGATNGLTFLITFLFLAGAATVFFLTWQGVKDTDWRAPVTIGASVGIDVSNIKL